MKVNGHAKAAFCRPTDPFYGEGVSGCNCYFGERAQMVRKKQSRVDRVNYIYNEKSRYVYAKRNIDGIRR